MGIIKFVGKKKKGIIKSMKRSARERRAIGEIYRKAAFEERKKQTEILAKERIKIAKEAKLKRYKEGFQKPALKFSSPVSGKSMFGGDVFKTKKGGKFDPISGRWL